MYEDILEANRAFQRDFRDAGLSGTAARGIAVVTCIDSRIEPLGMLGLVPGDAKIIRNAGARITDDVLRSLVFAVNLLGAERILVIAHTDCGVSKVDDHQVAEIVRERTGADPAGTEFLTVGDQIATLRADCERVRAYPLIPDATPVSPFIYDVHSGAISPVEP